MELELHHGLTTFPTPMYRELHCPIGPARVLILDTQKTLSEHLPTLLADEELESADSLDDASTKIAQAVVEERPFAMMVLTPDRRVIDPVELLAGLRHLDADLQFLIVGSLAQGRQVSMPAELWECLIWLPGPVEPTAVRQAGLALLSKWRLRRQISDMSARLERLVADRTADIARAHTNLLAMNRKLEAAKAAAEEANQAKSAFLATMSHEIRTPMTAILGYADYLLEEGDLQQAPTPRIEAINTIVRNGLHLVQLINDILDLSKIEANRLETERIPCQPLAVALEVALLMRPRAEEKHLELNVRVEGEIPETIQSDPTRIRQILVNLIGNAIKFTETGSVELVLSLTGGEETFLQFEIRDTGIGMSEAEIARLFRPFTQADSSMTRRYGGTGLGLCICKRLTEMLGGNISVESRVNQGSAFRFKVATGTLGQTRMLTSEAASQQKPDPVAEAQARQVRGNLTGRILLAEDGPDNQRLIAHILRKAGADVTVVENGQLAIEAILSDQDAGDPFDLILMDMQMPVLDGYAASQHLRQHGIQIPIIALTAFAMTGDRERCIESGCSDYLTKPIDRKQLLSVVGHHLADSTKRFAVAVEML